MYRVPIWLLQINFEKQNACSIALFGPYVQITVI